jgi:hypothetical protein
MTSYILLYNIKIMTWIQNSHVLFIYLGIFFFIIHLLVYGTGIDISYFGLFLIYVGYFKVELYSWVFFLVWMFILIEFTNLGKIFYKHIYKRYILKKNFYNFLNFRTSKN